MNLLIDWSDLSTYTTLLSLIAGLVGLIAAIIPLVVKLTKSLKQIVKDKNWAKIKDIIMAAITEAEASGKSGADKKQQVLKSVQVGCRVANIEITDELLKQISDFIDETIKFVNTMDTNKKIATNEKEV